MKKGLAAYPLAAFAVSIVLGAVAAFVLSSPEDEALRRQIDMYESLYPQLKADVDLAGEAVENLTRRDAAIYSGLFLSEAPSADAITAAGLIADSDSLMKTAARVDSTFEEIFRLLEARKDSIPPLTSPLKNLSFAQTGASTGEKFNPFFKIKVQHEGLDLVAPTGTLVFAAADGVVDKVENSSNGLGLVVTIRHGGGYCTRYGLLGDSLVGKGRKVKRGDPIGKVGVMPGFAPHLHYEVIRRGQVLDPVDHLFATVGPEDYSRMLYISARTLQSMD